MKRLLIILLIASSAHAQTFRTEAFRAHMRFLASDALEGRGAATRGHLVAAEYVAAQLELAGVTASFQEVPLLATVASADSTVTLHREGEEPLTLRAFDTFVTSGDPLRAETKIEAPVVFAGYGVTAREQRYDDYAGVDARGKIVTMFTGAPAAFPNAARAHYSSTLNKITNAAEHGAVAVLFLTSPKEAARTPWPRVVRGSKLGSMHWLQADGKPHDVDPVVSANVTLGLEATKQFFGSEAVAVFQTLESGGRTSRPPRGADGTSALLHIRSSHRKTSSPNVAGILRGSDPVLRDEYVIYTAHLDHLGITEAVDGDAINNGAFDNATGIAALLEIARAFGSLPKAPRRSILFLATTAEEKGLRGADYFANNPTVPIASIVANINTDMLLIIHRTRDLVAFGIDSSDLGDVARTVAGEMDIELSPDRFPEEVVFVRSDQYPFIRRGIPALFVNVGYHAIESGIDMAETVKVWRRTRYHSPSDDLSQRIDYGAAILPAEFNFRLGLAVANRDARPRWKPGDFFGQTFGRSR
ncbi:MAG TPA: M28 family metallopeptidase [Thermoanaerobaculia bacterium]|nr:M28 family metallopeptidase [Thermoanaerobaculia bacterium]